MTLETLPKNTALTGPNAIVWASTILSKLSAPINDLNVGYLCGWFLREGGGGQNNPMNTTLRTRGSEPQPLNSAGVQNYDNPIDGVDATVTTLTGYPSIIASLRLGRGIPSSNPNIESELSRWSGGGYSSITPVKIEIGRKGIAKFKGSINLTTGEWNIQGVPSEGITWEQVEKEFVAQIGLFVGGPKRGQWNIKGISSER